MGAARDPRGRFVPARIEAPVSTLTAQQHALAILVADFLAAIGARLAAHIDASEERRRHESAARSRQRSAARRAHFRTHGSYR